ncbi:MAG: Mu-like prophage major head subunit gpT family protein, partial [Candidatus Omnitrophica bacterium]|nr:Mu-like prophage major head subunit gpT family protein [Candidatus Omnitrophota bacterium]
MGVELLSSRAIIGTFYEELDRITANQQSLVNRLAFFVQATQREETYRWLGQVPQMREWNQGGRELQKLRDNEYKIKNKIWESTLEFQLDDLRLDKTGQVRIRIGELADRA